MKYAFIMRQASIEQNSFGFIAEDFKVTMTNIAELMKGSIIVGHSLKSDLDVLFLKHPKIKIRDTATYYRKKFKKPKTPSLKALTKDYLNVEIQKGEHSSVSIRNPKRD
jgi:RNA exonuclease 4